MATSGRMEGNRVAITSAADDFYFIDWQLAGQNIGGNYSTINWQNYFHFENGDNQLDNGIVNSNVGTHWHNGGRVYNYSGNFSTRNLAIASGSFNIGHDGAGNQSLNINGGITAFDTGRSEGSAWWSLPTIPRYANINWWNLNTITEKSMNVTVNVDRTCNAVDYSINGSGWIRGYNGNFTQASFTIGGLNPATQYSIKIRVHNPASGLWTDSGLQSATTLAFVVSTLTSPAQSDTTIDLRAVTNYVADLLQYRVQGTTTWTDVAGDFTTKTVTATGLAANVTYTFEVRAKHKDSQTYSPIKTVSAKTGFPQPLQPTNLAPAAGQGVGTLTPTLTWDYNATSPDSQTAYQVLIRRESDGVTVYDSGKVMTGINEAEIPVAAGLQYNVNYQWQVATWSGTDIAGPYSELALFKTSQVPVINVTEPMADEIVTTDAPLITWTFADPEGTPQTGFGITVERITAPGQTSGEPVYDVTIANSADTEFLLPANTLQNGERYIVRVHATDSDGITGTSPGREFLVNYVSPPSPIIDVELSENELFARINVSTTKPADDAFDTDYVRIYKRRLGETAWNYLDQIRVNPNYIDAMEVATGWSPSGLATIVEENALVRQGQNSLSFQMSGAGTGQFAKQDAIGSIADFDKIRLWIYALDAALITSLTFKMGTDASNYYSFTVPGTDLADTVWKSIEVDLNSLAVTGNPTLGNVGWKAVEIVSTAALTDTDLLVDSWNLAYTGDQLFVYDYILENKAEYEYAATAYNTTQNLESGRTPFAGTVQILYDAMSNIYLIPEGNENQAVIGFQDGKAVPNWATKTDTAYFLPVGAKRPTVYVMGNQRYRTGSMEITFWDANFGGNGLTGLQALEAIMNHKPLMARTWWGEIIYISIDGELNTERVKGLGWKASFSFTEIGSDNEQPTPVL